MPSAHDWLSSFAVHEATPDEASPSGLAYAGGALYARGAAGPLVRALRWLPAEKGQSRAMAVRAVLGLQRKLPPVPLGQPAVDRALEHWKICSKAVELHPGKPVAPLRAFTAIMM